MTHKVAEVVCWMLREKEGRVMRARSVSSAHVVCDGCAVRVSKVENGA